MNLSKEIKANTWIKNWSGNWRTAFATLYRVYTVGLKKQIGKNLETNLLICEKDVSSNYISERNLNDYCTYIANLVIQENKISEKWAKDTIITAEQLFEILGIIKSSKNITLTNLLLLKEKFYLHIPPHFSMKKVVDYLPEKLQKKLMPKLAEARIKTENLFNAVDAALRLYTKLIAAKVNYAPSLTEFLTIEEIEIFFRNNILPSKADLHIRSNGIGIFYKKESCSLLVGKDYNQLMEFLSGGFLKELRGSIAYPGIARGIVRVVFDPFKVKKFNQGDVLVTGMTRPEFLPLMKKASAFVTDAGGLLSHAAIVARELKKPCILATQVAIKVLKNGDLVEVDANKGVIRKLE